MKVQRLRLTAAGAAVAALLAACGGGDDNDTRENVRPAFVSGEVTTTTYDGTTDDLLTAGLGAAGLQSATAPTVSATPTAAELRRLAIYNNYRALVDVTTNGGYGVLYGPTIEAPAGATDGKIAGTEVIGYSDDGSGRRNVTLMVQIPDSFNPQLPCIITATSSGSRGVYGGIVTAEWGLKKGCAVAYTDKGTGTSPHDLSADTVGLIDGRRATAAAAGASAAFRARVTDAELATFNATTPNRLAYKHAHSEQNPEASWGTFTLQAIDFAFWALNERYGRPTPSGGHDVYLTPRNTLVIASSLSNGGAAAMAAAEQDFRGLVDGVAVAEPVLEMPAALPAGLSVQRGSSTPTTFGKPLYDYMSYANVFQPCAALAPALSTAALAAAVPVSFNAANRCASLAAKGLVTGATTADQATDALAKMRAYGWEDEATFGFGSHTFFQVPSSVTTTFAMAYARARVIDKLCNFSFAAVDGTGAPVAAAALATAFATGNGIPPSSGGIELINEAPAGGVPVRSAISVSPSTGVADINLDGALCLRDLLATTSSEAATNLRTSIAGTARTGDLHGKPAIIVHGRADALIPVNHNSRPYTALNKVVEGARSQLSYVEVTNAQHFESFIPVAGNDIRYVPLHVYLNRALDAMYAHLRNGAALPPSQVVRTTPRGGTAGAAPAISAANVPAIASAPAAGDAITMNGSTLVVPD